MREPNDFNITSLSDKEITTLLENYRRAGKTDHPKYLSILEEKARRQGKGLSFEKSIAAIKDAALRGKFLSYKQLAEASDLEWSVAVHYAMPGHLWDLVEYAHRKGQPLLSAIVVNQKHVETGEMEAATLSGFVAAARDLGIPVTDERKFLKKQQQEVFRRAKEGTLNV
jgi:hypothetical protein